VAQIGGTLHKNGEAKEEERFRKKETTTDIKGGKTK
jgi:hypothetical protein